MIFGIPSDSALQDYALTGFSYEQIPAELNQEYEKNNTKIIIKKQDDKTNQNLQGALFKILDENQKIIKKIETDKNGEIKLESILPGTYYIKEVQAPEGYEVNSEIQKIEIGLNEQKTLIVQNSKIIIETPKEEPKIEEPEPEIPVQKEELQIIEEVKKLPVTGM